MKTLLVLAQHPALAEEVRSAVNPGLYRVVHRANNEQAEPLLVHGLPDLCIVDVESTQIQGLWQLEKLRKLLPQRPLVVCTGASPWEWEEEAYVLGVSHFLRKPIQARYLNAVLDRLLAETAQAAPAQPPTATGQLPEHLPPTRSASAPQHGAIQTAAPSLQIMRDLSAVLTHSLCAEEMLKQFVLQLRELIGVNRTAIFLRKPVPEPGKKQVAAVPKLHLACAIGLPHALLGNFELSFETGIAAHLNRLGRILRRDSPQVCADVTAQKEFELLGAQVAIPIFDREMLVGIAVFDRRVTGEPLDTTELELIFHLLEQFGLAVKNIWLHEQLAANNRVLTEILRELTSGCVVVSSDLAIINVNRAARRLFAKARRTAAELDFADLPHALGSKVYEVLKAGNASGPFKFEPDDAPGTVFNVTVVPIFTPDSVTPTAALLTAEDLTQAEKLKQLEIEAANLRLIKTMADRSAHDIGNALVPLSTHQQLLKHKAKDPDFIASLDEALAEGVRRIARRVEQLRYLASDELGAVDRCALGPLLEDAFATAKEHFRIERAELKCDKRARAMAIKADRTAMRWALFEIILNALQANPAEPHVQVRTEPKPLPDGSRAVQIEIEDAGPGFNEEALVKAGTAFWTRRTVGMGLGLAVARKIVEMHDGRLEIRPAQEGRGGVVAIWIPSDSGGQAGTDPALTSPAAGSKGA